MKPAALLALALLAGCASTGNPRQGGLFGWSETKARARLDDRQSKIAHADAEMAREQARTTATARREQALSHDETTATRQRDRELAALREHDSAVVAKAAQLETESPTPATASRARKLRVAVAEIRRDARLSPSARAAELRRLEIEIDQARANLPR